MNDVVQNESIIAFNAVNLDTIRTLPDIQSAKECLARLSGFQKALQEADRFFNMSVEFAKLEAAALIRTCELLEVEGHLVGVNKAIKGDRGHAAVWIYHMTEEERNAVISECERGLTITQIYRMKMKPAVGIERVGIEAKNKKDDYLEEAEKTGIIDLSNFIDKAVEDSHKPGVQMAWFGTKESLRNTLLKNGFLGCGSNSQVYVDPKRSNQAEIYQAIATRLGSIYSDIAKLEDIAHTANIILRDLPTAKNIIWDLSTFIHQEGNKCQK